VQPLQAHAFDMVLNDDVIKEREVVPPGSIVDEIVQ
jgi:hypothetical protein